MEEGKNIFILDGPIGRKRFFINIAIIILYCAICAVIGGFAIGFIGFNLYTRPIIYTILAFILFLIYYMIVVNYTKRLQDITNISKWKCLLYVILYYIAIMAMGFIPILKYIAPIIGVMFFLCMSLIKGHLYRENTDVQSTENQVE